MAESFLSWSNLATFSGAVAAVVFLVQFLKIPIDKLAKVPTRIVVYVVSFAVLLLGHIFTDKAFNVEIVALCLVNAILVALSAMSLYEQTIAEPEATKNESIVQDTAQALADIISTQQPQSGLSAGTALLSTPAAADIPTAATDDSDTGQASQA